MVAIRHSVSTSDQQRTTMILLCEDGSLRIYMASAEHTGYWMSPEFQPTRLVRNISLTHMLEVITYFLGTNFIKCPLRTLDLKSVSSHYPKLEALCQRYIVIKQQHSDLLLIIDFAGQSDLKKLEPPYPTELLL